jgi:hypothetical protein
MFEIFKRRDALKFCGFCFLTDHTEEAGAAANSGREAYATVLHSGAEHVCGAIAVAQSIRRSGSTRDLVVLVDGSVSSEHRKGLEEAGWKVRDYVKINASSDGHGGDQKDFSMFRLWQLDYDKVSPCSLLSNVLLTVCFFPHFYLKVISVTP